MSLLEKLLSLFAAPEPVNIEKKEAPAPATSPNTCPQCGSSLFVEITGTVRRCAQCAFQQAVAPQRAANQSADKRSATKPIGIVQRRPRQD